MACGSVCAAPGEGGRNLKMGTVIGKEWYKFREIATIEGLSYSMVRYLFVR